MRRVLPPQRPSVLLGAVVLVAAALVLPAGVAGSNPAFLGGGSRYALAVDTAWEQRGLGGHPSLTIDEVESRLSAVTGKAGFGPLALGVSYQEPFHAAVTACGETTGEQLRTVIVGAALDALPVLRVGASMAHLMLEDAAGN